MSTQSVGISTSKPPICFSSVEEIEKWISAGDKLSVSKNQKLIFTNIKVLKLPNWEDISNSLVRVKHVFDQLVLPWAKVTSIDLEVGDEDSSIAPKINESDDYLTEISFSISKDWKLTLKNGLICTNFSDLFHRMISSNVFNIHFKPLQPVLLKNITREEQKRIIKDTDSLNKIMASAVPSRFVPIIEWTKISTRELSNPNNGIVLYSDQPWSISLKKGCPFKGSVFNFQEKVNKEGFTVFPGAFFSVEDPLISIMGNHYSKIPNFVREVYPSFEAFCWNQFLLLKGKQVQSEMVGQNWTQN